MRWRAPSPAMVVALVALVFSTTGLADAARHAVVSAIDGHPISATAARRRRAAARQEQEVPRLGDPDGQGRRAGGTARPPKNSPAPARRPPSIWVPGAWTRRPIRSRTHEAGKNNFIWASKACEAEGGWLPTASELLGAAERVKLESTIHDTPITATVEPGPEPRPERRTRDELDARSRPRPARRPQARRASAKAPPGTRVRGRPTRFRSPPTRCLNRFST